MERTVRIYLTMYSSIWYSQFKYKAIIDIEITFICSLIRNDTLVGTCNLVKVAIHNINEQVTNAGIRLYHIYS